MGLMNGAKGFAGKGKNFISGINRNGIADSSISAGKEAFSLGKFVVGGATLGAIGNTASHYFDESWTNSSSGPQSFMSGAGWGAAIGAGVGMVGSRGRYKMNVMARENTRLARENQQAAEAAAAAQKIQSAQGDMSVSQFGNLKDKTNAHINMDREIAAKEVQAKAAKEAAIAEAARKESIKAMMSKRINQIRSFDSKNASNALKEKPVKPNTRYGRYGNSKRFA